MNVPGLSGSLRKGSYNSMALRAAQKLAPAGLRIDIADIASFAQNRFGAQGELG